jgi:hypothetical protein
MVHRFAGRLLAALTAALVGVCLLPASAQAADLPKGTSLDKVPADAAFYSAALRNKEQFDLIVNSKAYARVRELPYVKEAIEKFKEEWKKEKGDFAEFRKWLEQPENKELVDVALDALSDEIFCYGGDGWTGLLELYIYYSRNSWDTVLDLFDGKQPDNDALIRNILRTLAAHPELVRVPDLTIGFKVKDAKKVEAQIKRLEALAEMAAMMEPKVKDMVKRQKVAGADFLTLTLEASMIDWPKEPFQQFEREKGEFAALEKMLKAQKLVIGLGVKDGYLLLTFGPSLEHVAKFGGTGAKLSGVKELAPLAKHADKKITSLSYSSKKFNVTLGKVGFGFGDPDGLAEFGAKAIEKAKVTEAKKKQMQKDLDELVKDLRKAIPERGVQFSFEFMTSRGIEGFSYDYGQHPSVDSSKPLTLLDHVGGNPILVVVGRTKSSPESWDTFVKWVKTAYGYADELAQANLQGADKEQYNQAMSALIPLLKRFDDVTRKMWIPALADGQAGFVLDAKWTSKQWLQAAGPPTDKALPLPELALLVGVSDPELLRKAVSEYREILNGLLALAAEKSPAGVKIDVIKIPPPESEKVAVGTLYYYPIPKEAGLDPQVVPTAGLGKDVAVLSLSKAHTTRLLTAKPFKPDSVPLADTKKPLCGAMYYDNVALLEAATPWLDLAVDYGVKNANPQAKEKDVEDMRKQVHTLIEVAKCLRSCSSATYLENGVLVRHFEVHIKDLDK